MKDRLVQFWRSRAPRERLILAGGLALLALALFYAYAWLPIQRELAQLRQTLPQLRLQARKLAQDADQAARLQKQPPPSQAGEPLTAVVAQRALASGLRERIESITPQDAGRVRVILPRVAFNDWISLLGGLQMDHGVRVESTRIEASDEAGMVSVEAVLVGTGE